MFVLCIYGKNKICLNYMLLLFSDPVMTKMPSAKVTIKSGGSHPYQRPWPVSTQTSTDWRGCAHVIIVGWLHTSYYSRITTVCGPLHTIGTWWMLRGVFVTARTVCTLNWQDTKKLWTEYARHKCVRIAKYCKALEIQQFVVTLSIVLLDVPYVTPRT